jgi:hypothetical protein
MASSSFRDSMNSLGWSRREEAPIDTSQQSGLLSSIKSLNPFGGDGYVQLPTTEGPGAPLPAPNRREEEEGFFACELSPSLVFLAPPPPAVRDGREGTSIYPSVPIYWGRPCMSGSPDLSNSAASSTLKSRKKKGMGPRSCLTLPQ